ncbi:MAG: exodeoxyribonuclease VII small subunit [Akkermansia sp.]
MSSASTPKKTAPRTKKQQSFGESTQRLEEIIVQMDDPQTSLESMIELVEEGLHLIRESRSILADAELRIQKLDSIPTREESPRVEEYNNTNDFTLI